MVKLFHVVLIILFGISHVHAVLLRETDTDKASIQRAKSYPAVCRLEFMEKDKCKQGTGVLIKTVDNIGWVLTAQHNVCSGNYDTVFDVKAHFEDVAGRQYFVKPLACAVPKSGPLGIVSCGIERDLALVAYELPSAFHIDPIPLCASTKGILTHDPHAGLSRGMGCVVGYGYHGINHKPETYGIDQVKRHMSTYFMEYKRSSQNIWSLFSSLSIDPLDTGMKSSPFFRDDFDKTEGLFMTRFARNKEKYLYYDQTLGWNADPCLITKKSTCITERIHPLQGLIQSGDSGAPLIVTSGGRSSVLGIVSHEYSDYHLCFKNSRFTPVGYYKDWLDMYLDDSYVTKFYDVSSSLFYPESLSLDSTFLRSCLSADVSDIHASSSSSTPLGLFRSY